MRYVAPIVEGHGEVEALPALLYRIASRASGEGTLRVNPPIRVKSGSLRGLRGLPDDLDPPQAPEAIRDAKEWLGARLAFGYDPVIHQLEFSRKFNLDEARANPFFNRFYEQILRLLEGAHDI